MFHSDSLTRFRGGALFRDILNRMKLIEQKIEDPRLKFYVYSGHDVSVAGILAAFGIHPKKFPEYASIVFIELHKDSSTDGKPFVKLFYKLETDAESLIEANIPDCEAPCTLDKLELARQALIPLNWEEECGIYNWYMFDVRTNFCMLFFNKLLKS